MITSSTLVLKIIFRLIDIIISMGNEICVGAQRQEPLIQIEQQEQQVALQVAPIEEGSKRILRERVEVTVFPILNKHVEERIKKLSNVPQNPNKIWKIKQPYNVIYANTDPLLSDELPKGYVQIYKLRENGEFQGYFEGNLTPNYEPELKGSIFVYPNASYFIGSSSSEGTYANEVTSLNYSGGWSNEQPQGVGVEKNNKGTFRGEYNLGEKEGEGRFEWVDGAVYEGCFLKGLFHGKGAIVDSENKYSYQGQFRSGEKHGKGIQRLQFEEYKGEFCKGKRCGTGILTIYNPDHTLNFVYDGQFCKGLPNGSGKITKSSNRSVCGLWEDGRMIAIIQ